MEKRRHKRLAMEIPITIRCGGKLIPATSLNFSIGGMLIKSDVLEISKNDQIEILFDLSHEEKDLALRGQVARVAGSPETYVGIQFSNFNSPSHKTLRQFLHQRIY